MTTLLDTLRNDALARRKARDPLGSFINSLVAEAISVGKATTNREPTDAETLGVIKSFIKRAHQAIEMGENGGRDMTAARTELAILEGYIPSQMDESALKDLLTGIVTEVNATTQKDTGTVMKTLKSRHDGAYDPTMAVQIVKSLLTA
jgi:uncharacterized protein YqeY